MTHWRKPGSYQSIEQYHAHQLNQISTFRVIWMTLTLALLMASVFLFIGAARADCFAWGRTADGTRICMQDDLVNRNPVIPEVSTGTTGSLMIGKITDPTYFIISNKNGPLVTINTDDGSIAYGEGYKPDDAARRFWDAISAERKTRNCP